jgi:2-amino-4-ketopentanoate thiolase alpha subunit
VPYVMRVSGFLLDDAAVGERVRVRTLIGRELSGSLTTVNPSYEHSFGETVQELLDIGIDREGI